LEDFAAIKNIIFDLGNVVIDIEPSKTYDAFAVLSKSKKAHEVEFLIKEHKIWANYEKGLITEKEFRQLLALHLDLDATDFEIDTAFNALLLPILPTRIDLIEKLGQKYRLFVLSNTSKIHMIDFEKIVEKCTGRTDFWKLFEKPYFSFEMGKLKPEIEIYQQVLSESNLAASETLFLDDLLHNIEAAKTLNINTIHIQRPLSLLEYLKPISK
jgi:glucose-1-phosphatase